MARLITIRKGRSPRGTPWEVVLTGEASGVIANCGSEASARLYARQAAEQGRGVFEEEA